MSFSYRDSKLIVKDISFQVSSGEFLSIIGPNGSGKSTILKCIARLLKPSNGTILINFKDVSSYSPNEFAKEVSYSPQELVRSQISVFDALLISRKPYMRFSESREDIEKVEEIIEAFKLEEIAFKSLNSISGGELQKVWIARALVQEPNVLLLDEPTNNLDIYNQIEIMELVKNWTKKRDIVTVGVLHDINIALRVSDKFLAVKNGLLISYGGREILTPKLLKELFRIKADILEINGIPTVIIKGLEEV
ncbi:iron complex transport system ATP-binding protein [Balnearium lithotrophicum]|uniref:Iron complex transport system ATP-binding protein n=1 Tax=Balnearium lithotrophicum TaxID=223788 RepID=A0A521BN37_9BACT|nr:ABC transporter ATP-binding protein [Balnearium lithotrophicum]SMO48536.1 iron complex transport system ATP-binding protein [Balnearium lithotrophicum]